MTADGSVDGCSLRAVDPVSVGGFMIAGVSSVAFAPPGV
jgi:hypothetical protein